MEKYYITTPIYFPNDKLHIGHTYTTVAADTIARYKRMRGYDVHFLTGTDEHGQKIERVANETGVTPKEYVDKIVESIKHLWSVMNISYDQYIRTTDEQHVQIVQKIFKKMYDSGDIYKAEYEGKYCTPCESFWTMHQLKEGGLCPDCGRETENFKETSYFFRLSKYQGRVIELLENNPDFLQPASRCNEMLNNFLRPGLEDLCVSRTSFKWGIPVTFDPGHIVYVWIDALSNYITALGAFTEDDAQFKKYWPCDLHLMAKEIVRFHAIIWPAMLMSLDLPLPKRVFGHGWLLFDGDKMSKSKGNIVDPIVLADMYGVDAIRYFLMREMPFGADSSFSNTQLVTRINADLANDLGNLLSRTTAMVDKYFGGKLPQEREAGEFDASLLELMEKVTTEFETQMDNLQLNSALAEIWTLIGRANKYIDETCPWILAKSPEKLPRLAAVLYNLCDVLRKSAVMVAPFMPNTAPKIYQQLGLGEVKWIDLHDGGNVEFTAKKGENLFPRIDVKATD